MNTLEIKNKFDQLLKQLSNERSFDVAEKITTELVGLLNIKTTDRFLVNIPRVDAELTRFQLAPGFARQAAAYELPHEDGKPIDLKLFWIKKASKTNLSWLIGLTPNFEDALSNDYKNIGIDFVVPETCDSIIVLLSNRFKIRALELKDHITPTQLEIFTQWAKLSELEIADQAELKNTLHSKLWESFNFEPINRKFYLELVEHFSILVHHLEKDFGRKQSVMFTTRLIGRLLFIWFLKKKNLVNNNVNYFSVIDPEKQSEYYKNQLEKLFFEVLNREELERDNGDKLTPYLNGGLFDKNTTDFFNDPKLTFPNGYFNQLFTTLNKYNFTVDESSPEFQHVAIDPEMLGRIFESLLAEQIDENTGVSMKKVTGAVYTPREIVSYMCEQSLIQYLKIKVPEAPDRDRRIEELVRMPEAIFRDQDQNKRRDWKPYREAIINALEGSKTESPLTVLDPAVGSGAFPMGMLHLLVKVYSRLDPKFEKDISVLKRNILSRSLYGVDIEQTAIEITRLRAWLSIIVDIPEGEKVDPLPNLEFKFVCANTLIPLDDNKQTTFFNDDSLKDKLIIIRNEYFKTSSKAKKEKLQKDYLKLTQNAGLFDNKKTQQLKSYKPFDISSSTEFYDPELMHGVHTFDIVIGNPPYLASYGRQAKKFEKEDIKFYIQNYKTFASILNRNKVSLNTIMLFFEKGLSLLKSFGSLTYIIDQAFLNVDVYSYSRKYLVNNFIINTIVSDLKFPQVIAEASIFEIINKKPSDEYQINWKKKDVNSEGKKINISSIKKNDYQIVLSLNEKVVKKIEDRTKPLCNCAYTSTGMQIIPEYFLSDNDEMLKNPKWHRAVFSSNILKYKIVWPTKNQKGKYITYDTELQKKVRMDLKNKMERGEKCRAPETLSIGSPEKESRFFNPKIILSQTVSNADGIISLQACLDDEVKYYGNVSIHLINHESVDFLKYLLSLINSKLMSFYASEKKLILGAEKGSKKTPQIRKGSLDKLPIKIIAESGQRVFVDLVDQILNLKKQNKDADTKNLELQIDQLVYKLYDLTPEEIEIVENSTK